jgi:hypothetical protein
MDPTLLNTKSNNRKTLEENSRVQEQILTTGETFAPMNNLLADYSKELLWSWAVGLSIESRGMITPPNRTERRMKQALVCWFCKWVPDFPRGVSPPAMKKRRKHHPDDLVDLFNDDLQSVDEVNDEGDSMSERWF